MTKVTAAKRREVSIHPSSGKEGALDDQKKVGRGERPEKKSGIAYMGKKGGGSSQQQPTEDVST